MAELITKKRTMSTFKHPFQLKNIVAALCLTLSVSGTLAQSTFPNKPITMVVGFAPGGGTDIVARIIARHLGEQLGQAVLVDNKTGAGGNIATDYVARSEPDGYTLLLGSVGSLTVAPHLVAKLPYRPLVDLAPVTMAVVFPNVLVVNPAFPAKTLTEYVKIAKDKPGTVTQASSGIGGAGHLAGELLKIRAGIDAIHVAYKGGGPGMLAVMGGEVNAYYATPVSAGQQIKNGKVRALATTGLKRDRLLPDVPTVAESGYPGYEATNWYAYVVPAKNTGCGSDAAESSVGQDIDEPRRCGRSTQARPGPQPRHSCRIGRFHAK